MPWHSKISVAPCNTIIWHHVTLQGVITKYTFSIIFLWSWIFLLILYFHLYYEKLTLHGPMCIRFDICIKSIICGQSWKYSSVIFCISLQVHEVQVTATGIVPDPMPVALNDVVVWTFKGLRHHNIVEVGTVDQLLDAQFNSPSCKPRWGTWVFWGG